MRKRILSLMLAVLVLFSAFESVSAQSKETDHDKDIKDVLLGRFGICENEEALDILQWASYFAMDCVGRENHNEEKALNQLRDYGIDGVPKKVEEFHYKDNKFENQYHERYTHRGWSDILYGYNEDENKSQDYAYWVKRRKPMLINAFTQVFILGQKQWWKSLDFLNLFSPKIDNTLKNQCESLAALIYYTHILGDHCYNSKSTLTDRIPMVRAHVNEDSPDLLFELKKHLAILFEKQISSS